MGVSGFIQIEKLLERKMDLIEDSVNTSLNNFQEYVDQKLSSLSRVFELEQQLAESRKHLEELKEKGKKNKERLSDSDNQSQLMVYRNAVEKEKQVSSSSEGEQMENLGGVVPADVRSGYNDVTSVIDISERRMKSCEKWQMTRQKYSD